MTARQGGKRMAEIILEYARVLVWPVTSIVLIILLRPLLGRLLGGSRITISLFGIEVETTIPELEQATTEYIGGQLTDEQMSLLQKLFDDGQQPCASGVPSDERPRIRPLRNAGLLMTEPRGAHLHGAEALRLTALGEFLVRHRTPSRR